MPAGMADDLDAELVTLIRVRDFPLLNNTMWDSRHVALLKADWTSHDDAIS